MFLDAASKVSGSNEFDEDKAFGQMKKVLPNVVKEYGQTSEFVNMFSQGEIAAGPIMEMYGRCFVLSCNQYVTKDMYPKGVFPCMAVYIM